jgi:urease accessory protein
MIPLDVAEKKLAAAQHQRVAGAARISFAVTPDGTTMLADLYQKAPCRVLFPAPEAGDPIQAVVLTTSGGLTGGDRTQVGVVVAAGARATVTTQAAEKIYRALPPTGPSTGLAGDARVEVNLTVGEHAWAEWLAQEAILFDGGRLRRTLVAEVAPQGRLLAVDSLVFGRTAMGESFDRGSVHDSWRITRAGRLIWADALHLDGDVEELRKAPFSFGTAVACSTLVYVGADSTQQLEAVRRILDRDALPGAATAFNGLLLIRILAEHATAMRSAVKILAAEIRRSAAGLPQRMPRVWDC